MEKKLEINEEKIVQMGTDNSGLVLETGYPHIDKPWMKYYDPKFGEQPLPKMGIYDYMIQQNKDNMDGIAITYYGNEIPYWKLDENIKNASKVLSSIGVKKDDRIMYLMPNIPETAYLMYGGARIGAVSDYVDPRPDSLNMKISAQKILNMFKEEKANFIVALDQCYLAMIKPIENELKELGADNIIVISASDSMNLKSKLDYLTENIKFEGIKQAKQKLNKTKQLNEMIQAAKNSSLIKIIDYKDLSANVNSVNPILAPYESGKIDLIVHTSGTTSSIPKPIPITNDNMNSYVHQTFGGNMTMAKNDKVLHMLPYFAAYGVVDVTHAGFCYGGNLIQIPEFSPSNLGKLILKHKPQTIIGAPTWFLNLPKDQALKSADLSFLKMITSGGDTLEVEDEEKINKFLKEHNCKYKQTKGHGMSETCGCASYAINDYNVPGTVGIPMPHTIYGVVDPDTKELIKFEDGKDTIEGELIISSPCITPGYLDDKVIVPHVQYDGMDFIYTRDVAKMDKNGIMTFLSRTDRSFTRFDGFKVKPYELEKILKEDEDIRYCVFSPYFDNDRMGNMILATIVLEDDKELSIEEQTAFVNKIINKYFIENPNVSTRQIPSKIKFKSAMPITQNGKVDYKAIEKEGITGEEITVQLNETNISVESIDIIPPTSPKDKVLKRI